MLTETFEQVLRAAQLGGSLTPAWKKFIKTKFFVAILRSPDDDPKNFLLCLSRNSGDGKPVAIIAEVRDRIDQHLGDGVVAVSGADIVRRLGDQGGILVELSDGPFKVSRKRVAWLKSGIEVTQARVATRKVLQAAAPAAPLPVLSVQAAQLVASAAPVPAGAASAPAPVRRSLEALAALHVPKPAQRTGLEFFEPSRFHDESAPPAASAATSARVAQLRALSTSTPAMLAIIAIGIAIAIYLLIGVFGAADAADAANAAPERPVPAQVAPVVPVTQVTNLTAPPSGPGLAPDMPFTPADQSFTVDVPGMPEELELSPDQVQQMGELRMHQYKLVIGERIYTMQATDYGARVPDNLAAAMEGMQNSIVGKDGILLKASAVGLRAAAGREVRVQLANGGVRAARFAFIGSKFCMVAVVAADGRKSGPAIDAFLNSFRLN